jgi:hypothetical protein
VEYAYLVSSLPPLTLGDDTPLSREQFMKACEGLLREDHFAEVRAILDGRLDDTVHPAARWFVARDVQLRSGLARARAVKAGIEPERHVRSFSGYDVATDAVVARALANPDPVERELLLDRHRWSLLEQMVSVRSFSVEAVLAYAFKLLIVERWQQLTDERGEALVREIVDDSLTRLGA